MIKNGHIIGGEESGHIIFSKYATTGDGLLTAMKVMEVMLAKKQSLSALVSRFTKYPQKLVNVRVMDKETVKNDPDVQKAIKEVSDVLGNNGRVLVRESGTEPVIRVMAEAKTEKFCTECVMKIVDVIKEKGYETAK